MKDYNSNIKRRIIAITGTPATGKTVLAGKLAQKLDAEIIDLTEIINKNKNPPINDRLTIFTFRIIRKLGFCIAIF